MHSLSVDSWLPAHCASEHRGDDGVSGPLDGECSSERPQQPSEWGELMAEGRRKGGGRVEL
jgi:hypothetical protein